MVVQTDKVREDQYKIQLLHQKEKQVKEKLMLDEMRTLARHQKEKEIRKQRLEEDKAAECLRESLVREQERK